MSVKDDLRFFLTESDSPNPAVDACLEKMISKDSYLTEEEKMLRERLLDTLRYLKSMQECYEVNEAQSKRKF